MCPEPNGYHDVGRSCINEKSESGTNSRAFGMMGDSVVAKALPNAYFARDMKGLFFR
jgi:hypothetical protein